MCWRWLIAASVTGPRFWRIARSSIAVTANLPWSSVSCGLLEYPINMVNYTLIRQKQSDFVSLVKQLFDCAEIARGRLGVALHFGHPALQGPQRPLEVLRVLDELLDCLGVGVGLLLHHA